MKIKEKIQIHFIDGDDVIYKSAEYFVPDVGDECRLWEDKFFRVDRIVWVYDEPDCPYARVNIGVTKIEL